VVQRQAGHAQAGQGSQRQESLQDAAGLVLAAEEGGEKEVLLDGRVVLVLRVMARKKIQWHPLFTRLLRPQVERYYEIRTEVQVGDLPRRADLVLLRRLGAGPLPFQGLWRYLTPWNALDFKGWTEAARPAHLPLLVELGLGIARRLHEEGQASSARRVATEEISFWYLASRLGQRFLQAAASGLQDWGLLSPGVWHGSVLGHPVFGVSTVNLPVDDESLPLHVLAAEPKAREREVGEFLTPTEERLAAYGGVFSVFHQATWKEVESMAQRRRRTLTIDISPVVETLGLEEVIRQIGKEKVIRQIGEEEVLREIGAKKVMEQLDVQTIWDNLPAAKRRQLKRLLAEE
jgi:hypothetical protein